MSRSASAAPVPFEPASRVCTLVTAQKVPDKNSGDFRLPFALWALDDTLAPKNRLQRITVDDKAEALELFAAVRWAQERPNSRQVTAVYALYSEPYKNLYLSGDPDVRITGTFCTSLRFDTSNHPKGTVGTISAP